MCPPFLPVPPEHNSRASRIAIRGFAAVVSAERRRWYAIEHAVMPDPLIPHQRCSSFKNFASHTYMIKTSTSSGIVSDLWPASGDGGSCQALTVGFATGLPGEPLIREITAAYDALSSRSVLRATLRDETSPPIAS